MDGLIHLSDYQSEPATLFFTQPPAGTSLHRGWPGLAVEVHPAFDGADFTSPPRNFHLVVCTQGGCGRFLQRRAGQVADRVVGPGTTLIVPAGHESLWLGDIPALIAIGISEDAMNTAASRIGMDARDHSIDIKSIFGVRDPTIDRLSAILGAEVGRPEHPCQPLLVEAATSALTAHLLRDYTHRPVDAAFTHPPGLSARVLRRVLQYIEDHLGESISVSALADHCNLSRFHFARLFKASAGTSPMAYLERARIERAKILIRESTTSIAEIALTVGYADQSHFTRRFSRQVGTTPAAFARDHADRRPPRASKKACEAACQAALVASTP